MQSARINADALGSAAHRRTSSTVSSPSTGIAIAAIHDAALRSGLRQECDVLLGHAHVLREQARCVVMAFEAHIGPGALCICDVDVARVPERVCSTAGSQCICMQPRERGVERGHRVYGTEYISDARVRSCISSFLHSARSCSRAAGGARRGRAARRARWAGSRYTSGARVRSCI